MTPIFIIDVWSDVICPFCYMAQRQLEMALAQFEHRDDVAIVHHAFELDPTTPQDADNDVRTMVAAKYGRTLADVDAMHDEMTRRANALGIDWHLDAARVTNSRLAHRLIALAGDQGRQGAMVERLFTAYFHEGALISDIDTLETLALDVGVTGASKLVDSEAFLDQVVADEEQARRLGITGVPAMIFNNQLMVRGARGADTVLQALEEAWQTSF